MTRKRTGGEPLMRSSGRTRPQNYPSKVPLAAIPEERRRQIADELLHRYIEGAQITQMQQEYGYSSVSLYALLWKEREEDWCNAQASRALARHADALNELDEVKAKLNAIDTSSPHAAAEISRQRELLKVAEARVKSAQWEME